MFNCIYNSTVKNLVRRIIEPTIFLKLIGVISIKKQTIEILKQTYIELQKIIANLYLEADNAVAEGNYSDASLLQSQADNLYQTAENLEIVIIEQEG